MILEEIKDELTFLIMDNYANYTLNCLFKLCTQEQRQVIIENIAIDIHSIAKNKKGTHCLQNLIELITTEEEEEIIIESIEDHIFSIAKDRHGFHFIKKAISIFEISQV